MHLMVDGVCGNKELLTSVKALEKWLLDIVAFIGMKVIGGPWIIDYPAGNGYEKGLSGIILLAESSITIHTWPEYAYTNLDIFSCNPFDTEGVLDRVRETFGMTNPVVHEIERNHGEVSKV